MFVIKTARLQAAVMKLPEELVEQVPLGLMVQSTPVRRASKYRVAPDRL
ncbi:hypothetical protein [Amycolatopsis sp. H20-H5]|nr:hypothetical protein [Amycolatopsis sp. H20-H5]MEC3976963.1 hypothetical protein [Amycolatopsis sp. H20-H5]